MAIEDIDVKIEEHDWRGNVIYTNYRGSENFYKYDKNNNMVYEKGDYGPTIYKYDDDNNLVYIKRCCTGAESWSEYNNSNKEIHYKHSDGAEYWYKYDKTGDKIVITEEEFKELENNDKK